MSGSKAKKPVRDRQVLVRLSRSEFDAAEFLAERYGGMSVQDLIRMLVRQEQEKARNLTAGRPPGPGRR